MSLGGFKAGDTAPNHPHAIAKRGFADDATDTRETPAKVFDPLHEEFGFSVDAAASAENAKLPRYWTRATDGLAQSWAGERVWCNPPFSGIRAWVEKARAETIDGRCPLVVMLVPANRTDAKWWHEHVEGRSGVAVRFLQGRFRFAPWKSNAPFGLAIVVFRRWFPGA